MSALSGGASPRMDGYGERLRAGQGYDRWLACGGVVLGIGLSLALAHLRFYAQLGLPLTIIILSITHLLSRDALAVSAAPAMRATPRASLIVPVAGDEGRAGVATGSGQSPTRTTTIRCTRPSWRCSRG